MQWLIVKHRENIVITQVSDQRLPLFLRRHEQIEHVIRLPAIGRYER